MKSYEVGPEVSLCPDGTPHHWVIESPDGPVSRGVCRGCGETQEFLNSWSETKWDWVANAQAPSADYARELRRRDRQEKEDLDSANL